MLDYWVDGQIDCKDYAIYNVMQAIRSGSQKVQVTTINDNHVVVIFEKDGYIYIADNDKLYRTPKPIER
jgi:hypothetical protein